MEKKNKFEHAQNLLIKFRSDLQFDLSRSTVHESMKAHIRKMLPEVEAELTLLESLGTGEGDLTKKQADILNDVAFNATGGDTLEDLAKDKQSAEKISYIIRETISRSLAYHRLGTGEGKTAEEERLKTALLHDETGLAKGLEKVLTTARGFEWVCEGRGHYEWDDQRYRDEMQNMITSIIGIAKEHLTASGVLVRKTIQDGLFSTPNKGKTAEIITAEEYLRNEGLKNPPLDSGISGGGDAPRRRVADVMRAYAKLSIHKGLTAEEADFIWRLLPGWVKDHPAGLSPMFYGTLTQEGDIEVGKKARVILYGSAPQEVQQSPTEQKGARHE